MKRRTGLLFTFLIAMLLWQPPNALGSLEGYVSSAPPCGSSGSFYTNLTNFSIDFELSVNPGGGSSCDSVTISWTDTSGHARSLTVPTGLSSIVSSSLQANGALSWSSSGNPANVMGFSWQLERAPAQSVTGAPNASYAIPCGSSGTVYSNLRSGSVGLDLAVANGGACSLTLSWADASGHAQTLNLPAGFDGTQAASTSLPAGGAISWTSTGTGYLGQASWQIERVVTTKLW